MVKPSPKPTTEKLFLFTLFVQNNTWYFLGIRKYQANKILSKYWKLPKTFAIKLVFFAKINSFYFPLPHCRSK